MLKLSNGLAEKSNETEQKNQWVPTTGCYGQMSSHQSQKSSIEQ